MYMILCVVRINILGPCFYTDALGRASTEEDEFIEKLRVFFLKVNRTNIYF